jgi:hypothetical protein
MWSDATAVLREEASKVGWSSFFEKNIEGVSSPSGRDIVLVTLGTAGCGDPKVTPTSLRQRGQAIEFLVNAPHPSLFGDHVPGRRNVWMLLHHQRPDRSLGCELSLSAGVHRGSVTRWHERILLEDPTGGGPGLRPPLRVPVAPPPVDVRLQRRSS